MCFTVRRLGGAAGLSGIPWKGLISVTSDAPNFACKLLLLDCQSVKEVIPLILVSGGIADIQQHAQCRYNLVEYELIFFSGHSCGAGLILSQHSGFLEPILSFHAPFEIPTRWSALQTKAVGIVTLLASSQPNPPARTSPRGAGSRHTREHDG